MSSSRYLNFGCGGVFHPEWTNVDMSPVHPEVIACDLTKGLPFPDQSFDVVYSSHVMEHFHPTAAAMMLRECRRVLVPGGICRIVVPDLEDQARTYLAKLQAATPGDARSEAEYDWSVLELIDQMVREKPGGQMYEYLIAPNFPAAEFVGERVGKSALATYRNLQSSQTSAGQRRPDKIAHPLRRLLMSMLIRMNRLRYVAAGSSTRSLSADGEAAFRQTGEVHRWAYDRFSMRRALLKAGFSSAEVVSYTASRIPDFSSYLLDMTETREERRPHSVYIEGIL